jgi:hypothetical protein
MGAGRIKKMLKRGGFYGFSGGSIAGIIIAS